MSKSRRIALGIAASALILTLLATPAIARLWVDRCGWRGWITTMAPDMASGRIFACTRGLSAWPVAAMCRWFPA